MTEQEQQTLIDDAANMLGIAGACQYQRQLAKGILHLEFALLSEEEQAARQDDLKNECKRIDEHWASVVTEATSPARFRESLLE